MAEICVGRLHWALARNPWRAKPFISRIFSGESSWRGKTEPKWPVQRASEFGRFRRIPGQLPEGCRQADGLLLAFNLKRIVHAQLPITANVSGIESFA